MKKFFSIAILLLATAGFAAAQPGAAPTTDVLGAHLNYGRGCAACHAPHSGVYGNGKHCFVGRRRFEPVRKIDYHRPKRARQCG
jgi:hypothetical protein